MIARRVSGKKEGLLRYELGHGEVLTLQDLVVKGSVRVQGAGDVVLHNVLVEADSTGVMVNVAGQVTAKSVRLVYKGDTVLTRWSGFVIHGASGGRLSTIRCFDFPGNAFLLERDRPIQGLRMTQLLGSNCGGGMWLLDAEGCEILNTRFHSCYYPFHPKHRYVACGEGPLARYAVIDERIDPSNPQGTRLPGLNLFDGLLCL